MKIRTVAAIGLGGNIGQPVAAMSKALQIFDQREDCNLQSVSRLYRTPPWGKTDQDWFFNACALVETALEPDEFLALCQDIENQMQRVRAERWGPRTLDVDILTYGLYRSDRDVLTVPHPRMTERGFVMYPLSDIAPDQVINGRSVADWQAEIKPEGIEPVDDSLDWWKANAVL